MDIREIPLSYYCEPGKLPFFSITGLDEKAAFEKAAELAVSCPSPKNKFCESDFPGYYAERIRTEEWLYTEFVRLGGKPEASHPVYFVLGSSAFLHHWFGDGPVYTVSHASFPAECLSFTIGDSMNIVSEPKRRVYRKEELAALLAGYETLSDLFADMPYQCSYIEAQLWRTLSAERNDTII